MKLHLLFNLLLLVSVASFAQTGGSFDLSHSVIAGGGGSNSVGGTFNVSATAGQHIAGTISNGETFLIRAGFWDHYVGPTAALASISGRITTAGGQGIRGVRLTLTAPDGSVRRATTSTFGYYAFDGVEVGNTYVLTVAAKRYTFQEPTRIFSLQDSVTHMDFVAVL